MTSKERADVRATPADLCHACLSQTLHTEEQKRRYHPLMGHGCYGAASCACGNPACPYSSENRKKVANG